MTHGLSTYRNHGCRCETCVRANTRYCKWYRHTARSGRRTVAAEPIREHLVALVASGWSLKGVSRETGVAFGSVQGLHVGRLKAPLRRTAAAILALDPFEPVTIDPVVVERLVDGADWRTIGATRQERIEAAELMPSRAEAERRLGLRAGRDFAVRGVA